jgi:regulator of protease activity HflC (stomatin/prohibitin superfamily)
LFLKKGDIKLPARVQDAMQMQVEAERKKRAAILESEGIREAEINVAEGKKRSKILSSGKMILYYFLIFIPSTSAI